MARTNAAIEGDRRRSAAYRARKRAEALAKGGPIPLRIDDGGRQCTRCREYKSWDQFPIARQNRRSRRPNCTPCHNTAEAKRAREARAAMPEAVQQRRSDSTMLWRHGVDREQYDSMLAAQGGGCAICGSPDARSKKKMVRPLVVDHDHQTGAVRGLLCDPCNVGLGRFSDDVERLTAAIHYLKGDGHR